MLVVWCSTCFVAEVADVGAPALETLRAFAGTEGILDLDGLAMAAGEGVGLKEGAAGWLPQLQCYFGGKSGRGSMIDEDVAGTRMAVANDSGRRRSLKWLHS